jgi:hypothetical protein
MTTGALKVDSRLEQQPYAHPISILHLELTCHAAETSIFYV